MKLSEFIKCLQNVETLSGGELDVFVERDGEDEKGEYDLKLIPAAFYIALDQHEKPACLVIASEDDLDSMCEDCEIEGEDEGETGEGEEV